MTAAEFKEAQTKLRLMNKQMAFELGISHCTIERYRNGNLPIKKNMAMAVKYLLLTRL